MISVEKENKLSATIETMCRCEICFLPQNVKMNWRAFARSMVELDQKKCQTIQSRKLSKIVTLAHRNTIDSSCGVVWLFFIVEQ